MNQIVSHSSTTEGMKPFLWSASGGLVDLGDLPGGDAQFGDALDINEAGEVVGYSTGTRGERAFLWTAEGGLLDLGDVPGHYGSMNTENAAFAINSNRQIVGRAGTYERVAFLWTESGGMQDLNLMIDPTDPLYGEAILFQALDINDRGQIVAQALIGGSRRAVLLTPIPEPTTASLMLVGALALGVGLVSRRPHRHMIDEERSGIEAAGLLTHRAACKLIHA